MLSQFSQSAKNVNLYYIASVLEFIIHQYHGEPTKFVSPQRDISLVSGACSTEPLPKVPKVSIMDYAFKSEMLDLRLYG